MNSEKFRLYILYSLIYPGLTKLGDPATADVIAVQAFGRNRYQDQELPLVRRLYNQRQDDWTTVNQLRKMDFDFGEPNRQLAKAASELADQYQLPIITQWEVAVALEPGWYDQHRDQVICLWPSINPKEYFTTHEVKRQTVEIMEKRSWQIPLELSHQRMIIRAVLILYRLGVKPVVSQKVVKCFDRRSSQFWTIHPLPWLIRETITRLIHHPFIKRWI